MHADQAGGHCAWAGCGSFPHLTHVALDKWRLGVVCIIRFSRVSRQRQRQSVSLLLPSSCRSLLPFACISPATHQPILVQQQCCAVRQVQPPIQQQGVRLNSPAGRSEEVSRAYKNMSFLLNYTTKTNEFRDTEKVPTREPREAGDFGCISPSSRAPRGCASPLLHPMWCISTEAQSLQPPTRWARHRCQARAACAQIGRCSPARPLHP